jgi:hypothetical protein
MKQSLAAFAALVPIFALILLGYGLRRYRIVPDEFWVPAEKLTYYTQTVRKPEKNRLMTVAAVAD